MKTGKTYIFRDVIFIETEFPFEQLSQSVDNSNTILFPCVPYVEDSESPIMVEAIDHSVSQLQDVSVPLQVLPLRLLYLLQLGLLDLRSYLLSLQSLPVCLKLLQM